MHKQAKHTVLIAAGIGITPIKSMALALLKDQASFEVHYAGKSLSSMAFTDRLSRQLAQRINLYSSADNQRINFKKLMQKQAKGTHFYFCGPESMRYDYQKHAHQLNIPAEQVHFEQFSAASLAVNTPCQIRLNKSQQDIKVRSDESLLDALLASDIDVPYSCQTGDCKTCVVNVAPNTEIDHRDNCLTVQEQASGKICLCVSRPKSSHITIEL